MASCQRIRNPERSIQGLVVEIAVVSGNARAQALGNLIGSQGLSRHFQPSGRYILRGLFTPGATAGPWSVGRINFNLFKPRRLRRCIRNFYYDIALICRRWFKYICFICIGCSTCDCLLTKCSATNSSLYF